MTFDFLKKHYPQFLIEVFSQDEYEWAVIHHPQSDSEIRIYYTPDDFQMFVFRFEYQHIHINSESELLSCINKYISGQVAAIEFFKGTQQCFGGDIETRVITNRDFDALSRYFGYSYNILKDYHFVIKAWNPSINCSGHFETDSDGKAIIVLDKGLNT